MSLPLATTDVGLAATAAVAVEWAPVGRAIGLSVVWTILTLVVGAVLTVERALTTRAIRDDIVDRWDLAFAAGFVVFFAPLVAVSLPLFVLSYVVDHPAVLAVGALVSLPSLLVWGLALLVGGALGVITAGDRIARRFGAAEPSLERSLVIGLVTVGTMQLVPILGVMVVMGLATLGTGAAVRRRFDVPVIGGSSGDSVDRGRRTDPEPVDWEPVDANGTAVWRSSDEGTPEGRDPSEPRSRSGTGSATAATGAIDLGADGSNASRDRSDGSGIRDGDETSGTEGDGTVDDWEWNLDTGRGDDETREDRDERRSESERRERSE